MNYYRIAGLLLGIDARQPLQPELENFRAEAAQPDVAVSFSEEAYKGKYPEKALLTAPMITVYETADRYIIKYNQPSWIECYNAAKNTRTTTIYLMDPLRPADELNEDGKNEIMYSIRDTFFFHIQKAGYIAVHSASFIYGGKAWLFSAPSGTGKSTHVDLWKQAGYGIEMLNGDVAVCFVKDGVAYVAGLPWYGTSGIYKNCIIPLGGILFLERSCHNQIGRLNAFESIIRLNARCLTPNWNQELMGMNLNTIKGLEPFTAMGVLYCRPDMEAAMIAKEFIDSIGD